MWDFGIKAPAPPSKTSTVGLRCLVLLWGKRCSALNVCILKIRVRLGTEQERGDREREGEREREREREGGRGRERGDRERGPSPQPTAVAVPLPPAVPAKKTALSPPRLHWCH